MEGYAKWKVCRAKRERENSESVCTRKSHWFAAHTCSISDTSNLCVKYHTDRLSMKYSLSIELS